ncbi:glycine betaine/L-proline ABC transporter permease ProW [Actimicrobium sp. CCI2.3]|uniref:glycine betaine/L-proline ABC transporter permease ProW n=1 Tax=Actimicrobium sp. CCI2.3 TaxID=3048616 RepID=UPI002AB52B05|nr:glycine betaine/L-proline ABC transporter permease ProW [Actimicrobium sp. CCI2.3]MDY7574707.1 glycine betaine/L-proline ABC transporter permease ProW [Actimicrobium sp. CCI2.3]MEB0020332.1 glycine betaine/L-proline ABC transporter permease ProW [Actimicrobium sp. CCI2.3]
MTTSLKDPSMPDITTTQAVPNAGAASSLNAAPVPESTTAPVDPWATGSADTAASADPWATGGADAAGSAGAGAGDWMDAPVSNGLADAPAGFMAQIQQFLDGSSPIESWINHGLDWFVTNFRPFFQTVRVPIDNTLSWVEGSLQSVPTLAMIAVFGMLAWQFAGRAVAVGTVISLLVVAGLGIWPEAMVTLSLVLTSLAFCLAIGLPLGILLARSDSAQRITRPILDAMQTTPAFVYLVPVVMLFGIGNVPGVIVTIIFALPPLVRLTNLGIRQVRPDLIEAARAYGASPAQMLLKVQLPLALPSIMAGVNQTLMLSLSMVVIASMIAVGGLGQMVLRGIGRLDMGLATVGGLGIVLLAISLDRITQAAGQSRRGVRHWYETGPVGLFYRMRPASKVAHLVAPKSTPTETGKSPLSTASGVAT